MRNFPIVDAHLHVWDPDKLRYSWLGDIPALNRPYLPPDFMRACGNAEVERIVFVQAEADFPQHVQEVEWVTALSKDEPRIQGIVAWAPLENGASVEEDLDQLAGEFLVKGIRRIIQFESDPEFCLQPGFVEGVRLLPGHGLSFDICVTHTQMANTIRLVERCPEVRFVLDHIGKPDIKHQLLDPWREELRVLSTFPNVWCKMSGLVTEADHRNWTADQLKPYINHVLSCFGFERTMYGGDWPVAARAAEYPRWVETLEWAVSGCSPQEIRRLFHDNGVEFYRLEREI